MNKAEKYYDENHVTGACIIHLNQEWYNVSMLFKLMEDFANQRVKEEAERMLNKKQRECETCACQRYDHCNGYIKAIEHLKKKAE